MHLIGWLGSALSMVSMMPQTYSTLRGRNIEGVSLSSFALLVAASVCWLTYGFVLTDYPMIITNIVMLITSGSISVALLKQRLPVIIFRIGTHKNAADMAKYLQHFYRR